MAILVAVAVADAVLSGSRVELVVVAVWFFFTRSHVLKSCGTAWTAESLRIDDI